MASIMTQCILYGKLPSRVLPGKLTKRPSLGIFPGIYFALFVYTMAVLLRPGIARTEVHRVMIATAILMWIIATGVRKPRLSYAVRPAADPYRNV